MYYIWIQNYSNYGATVTRIYLGDTLILFAGDLGVGFSRLVMIIHRINTYFTINYISIFENFVKELSLTTAKYLPFPKYWKYEQATRRIPTIIKLKEKIICNLNYKNLKATVETSREPAQTQVLIHSNLKGMARDYRGSNFHQSYSFPSAISTESISFSTPFGPVSIWWAKDNDYESDGPESTTLDVIKLEFSMYQHHFSRAAGYIADE